LLRLGCLYLQKKLIQVHEDAVVKGTGVNTAFLSTEKVDEMMATLVAAEFNEQMPAAKARFEVEILTQSTKSLTGFLGVKTRVFLKRVLPRWQKYFTKNFMSRCGERASFLLKTGKASGEGTRGHIPALEPADDLTCLKCNWCFTTANGRDAVNCGAKYAFERLGCLSSVHVPATENEGEYRKMRTALYARVIATVRDLSSFCPARVIRSGFAVSNSNTFSDARGRPY